MRESGYDQLRRAVLDASLDPGERRSAIAQLVELGTRGAAEALLELGAREGENEEVLRAAGAGLARLQASGTDVSEWDIRDLTLPAAETFLE